MKSWESFTLDPKRGAQEVDELRRWLRRHPQLDERKQIQPFFQKRRHLSAFLAFYNPDIIHIDRLAFQSKRHLSPFALPRTFARPRRCPRTGRRQRTWAAAAACLRLGSPRRFACGHGFWGRDMASEMVAARPGPMLARRLPL